MNNYAIKDLEVGRFFSKPLMLDAKYILLSPEMPIRQELIKALIEWDYKEVFSEGEPSEKRTISSASGTGDDEADQDVVETQFVPLASSSAEAEKIREVHGQYRAFYQYVANLFARYISKGEINSLELNDRIKALCELIKEDRRYLLRINEEGDANKNYLVLHTVRSTIIAISIGFTLKFANHRLIELGVAAVLHEIGMLKLPPQLYMTNRPLEPQERKAILTHTILGFNILKAHKFPLNVCIVALEHHERENGNGYPRRLTGDKISQYSKIIAVACSYEALTTARPYKTAKDGYTSMIDLLKNVGKQYDDQIIRALVFTLSIYPIGLYVLLSNGQKAQVIDVNPENPRFPIVQILDDPLPDGRLQQLETVQNGIHISRPLTKEELPGNVKSL